MPLSSTQVHTSAVTFGGMGAFVVTYSIKLPPPPTETEKLRRKAALFSSYGGNERLSWYSLATFHQTMRLSDAPLK